MNRYDKAQLLACLLILLGEVVLCAVAAVFMYLVYKFLIWGL